MLDAHVEFRALESILKKFGVKHGDVLYVASDITMLMYKVRNTYNIESIEEYDEYLNALVDKLQEIIGNDGTLLFPVFTWGFCRGEGFSIKESACEVGALNNWILKNRRDFQRTQHPMYSFMVWGKDARLLAGMQNIDGWGDDSPFAYLRENNATTLTFDILLGKCFTFKHYVERCLKVPWRYTKEFAGNYTDADGHTTEKIYSMYVRDLDIVFDPVSDIKEFAGKDIFKHAKWFDIDLWFMNCSEAFSVYIDDIKNNDARGCYKFKNYHPDWTSGQTHPDVKISI
ncbi:Aminoglycoside 3-N-acetyltransferase [Anaerovibrio lipolyticus DSM 3074]|uniref:Aminoglycoside N(3)-acetyltransferase n=1 Tax=Anaerovibrio lipolyticus DSM 3074 TaxID=1120997 RepID=A0A1M6FE46_9FIRM|nr:AAC(3) family N-acetyltransferase [Anaerovibrio lipolyticus]SHI95961.1 Aminoglycoside 3-N-acetyltransferase [Anaerovibrio lipolyticus DSM 3074]